MFRVYIRKYIYQSRKYIYKHLQLIVRTWVVRDTQIKSQSLVRSWDRIKAVVNNFNL